MAPGNQQKHLEFTFSIKALSFDSRTSIRAHKHIPEMVILPKIKRTDLFSAQHSYVGVTHCENFEDQIAPYETCCGNGHLYKDLLFVYLQPSVNKNW